MSVVPFTATCPFTVPWPDSAFSTTRSEVAGSTSPRAPSSRAASATPRTRSPVASISPARIRLPSACPASSPSS